VGGWLLGAIAVVVAFFGPTALLAFVVAKGWRKLDKWPWRPSVQQGLAPVSIGLLLAGTVTMGRGAVTSFDTAVLAVGVLLMLLQYKINPVLLVVASAVIGLIDFPAK